MKRILLIIPYGSVGGMERLALNFYNQYRLKGYSVKVVKIIQLPSDIIHFGNDEIALSKIDFNEMSFLNRFLFYIKIPFLLRKIIKNHTISHSIAFGDMANVFSSLTFTNEFKVGSIHSFKSIEFTNKNFLNFVFKFAFKTSYYFFDSVVCISKTIRKDLVENCGYRFVNKLRVIYNPHDIKNIQDLANIPIESQREREIFNNKVIVFVGRITNVKALWHLVKAFSLVENKNNKIKLVFIGDGDANSMEYINHLISKLNLNSNVIFLGRKNNPYHYLKRASVLALTSYYEGTPNVIIEAIVNDVPIVSSNCTDGILELMSINLKIENNNCSTTESGIITPNFFKGSLLVPNNDNYIQEEYIFASALESVLNDATFKERLILNKNFLLNKFDLEINSEEYLQKINN